VSTAIAGMANARLRVRLAVFLPTPGREISSSLVDGIWLLKLWMTIFDNFLSCLDLTW